MKQWFILGFCLVVCFAFPLKAGAESFSEQDIAQFKELFVLFDKNKSQRLTLEEFSEFMTSTLGKAPSREALLKEFNHADNDNNETISEEEFLRVARRAMSYSPSNTELRTWFQSFDKNADDLLDIEELKQMPTPSGKSPSTDEINLMLQEADQNGDGQIDFDEFLKVVS